MIIVIIMHTVLQTPSGLHSWINAQPDDVYLDPPLETGGLSHGNVHTLGEYHLLCLFW